MNAEAKKILKDAQDIIESAWEIIEAAMAQKAKDYEEEQRADHYTSAL